MIAPAQNARISTANANVTARQMPPAATGWPLIGPLPEMLTKQLGFLMDARRKYGDIYTLSLGSQKVVMLNSPLHAQHVFRDNVRNYRKGGKFWDIIRDLLGNGLVVSEGDYWLRQRRMMQPQFHRQRLAALTDLMIEAIDDGLKGWEAAGDRPFDLAQAFTAITLKIITRTMFGGGLSREDIDRVSSAVNYLTGYIMRGVMTSSLPQWVPVPGAHRFDQASQDVDVVLQRVIARSQQAEREGRYEDNLISMLRSIEDEETGERMTDRQIRDEAMTIFLAGYETTSLTLSWTMYLLLKHPDKMAQVKAEIDAVLGDQPPTFESLARLPYTRMAIQEAMRLYPPAWWLPRVAVEDDVIDGYRIPAGTLVVLPIYVYHHHPDFWENPEAFDPERFMPERSAGRHPYAWIPFGAGQRLCLGRDFALMEAPLVLAMTLQQYDIAPVDDREVKPQLGSGLKPKGGVWAVVAQSA